LDPDEFCQAHGAGEYAKALANAKKYFYWLTQRELSRPGVDRADSRIAVMNLLIPKLRLVGDQWQQIALANEIAAHLQVGPDLTAEFRRSVIDPRQEKPMERPQVALRHDERLLLNAILADEEVGKEIVGQSELVDATATFASHRVFQAAHALVSGGGHLDFESLHARLDEADQNLLARAVLDGDSEPSDQ
jgi:DNA primase